jgi:hypothetical protein
MWCNEKYKPAGKRNLVLAGKCLYLAIGILFVRESYQVYQQLMTFFFFVAGFAAVVSSGIV